MKLAYILTTLLLLTGLCVAQKKKTPAPATPKDVEITAEPHHRLIFQNEYVRVFDAAVSPKDATLVHWHRHDYVYVVLDAATISNEVKGQSPVKLTVANGDVKFAEGGFAHITRNVGDTPFHCIAVEFLQDAQNRNATADKWSQSIQVQGGNENVLFIKDGVRVAMVQLETAGFEKLHHHDGPQLVIALTDLTLRLTSPERGPGNLELKSGQIRWMNGNLTHSVTNVGSEAAKLVSMEF